MTPDLYLLLIVIATAGTAVVLVLGTQGSIGGLRVDRRTGIVVSAFVFVVWGLVAVNSFEITVYSGGSEATEEYPQMAFLAVAGAAAALYSLFQASLEEIRETGGI